jgi:hypothetical protein
MKTAVEWLIENSHIIPKNELNKRELIKQANEMFERQIKDAWYDGWIERANEAEQYYNETFKSE